VNDQERVKKAQALKNLREIIAEEWPAELERFAILAKLLRAKYLALIKEGFTPAEALELCKAL